MAPRGRGGGPRVRAAELSGVIAPVVEEAGFDLEGVSVRRIGRRHLVRVVIDRDGGVDVEAAAAVSRAVSARLDQAEADGDLVIDGEYVLEVSSPGVDRPLTEPRHWRRSVGRLVTVQVTGVGKVTGRVRDADDTRVVLEVDGAPKELTYQELGPGRVEVELRRLEEEPGEGEAA